MRDESNETLSEYGSPPKAPLDDSQVSASGMSRENLEDSQPLLSVQLDHAVTLHSTMSQESMEAERSCSAQGVAGGGMATSPARPLAVATPSSALSASASTFVPASGMTPAPVHMIGATMVTMAVVPVPVAVVPVAMVPVAVDAAPAHSFEPGQALTTLAAPEPLLPVLDDEASPTGVGRRRPPPLAPAARRRITQKRCPPPPSPSWASSAGDAGRNNSEPRGKRPRPGREEAQDRHSAAAVLRRSPEPMEVASEEEWQRRLDKRQAAVSIVKEGPEYVAYRAAVRGGGGEVPRTPPATDRSVSKRTWEEMMGKWRSGLKQWSRDHGLP